MMLIESKVKLRYTAELDFTYEDHGKPYVHKHVELNEKDRVKIKFVDRELKRVVEEEGVITKIYETMGRTSCVMFTLDCSHNFNSKIYNISADSIRMVEVIEDVVDEEFTPNIEWSLNRIKVIKNEEDVTGMMVIPYNRLTPGKVTLVVRDAADKVLYKEIYTAAAANENASFSFTLRDFSYVADQAVEAGDTTLLIDDEGNYVYRNGDAENPIIIATDRDNDLLIAAGSLITIQITHETEPCRPSENIVSHIATTYVVSRKDVKLATYVEPEDEPVVPPTDVDDPTIPPDDSEGDGTDDGTGTTTPPVIDDVTGDYTDPSDPDDPTNGEDNTGTENPPTENPDDSNGEGNNTDTPTDGEEDPTNPDEGGDSTEDPSTENPNPDDPNGGEDPKDPEEGGNTTPEGEDNTTNTETPEENPDNTTTDPEDPVDTPTTGDEGTSNEDDNTSTEEGTIPEDGTSTETTEES